MRTCRLFAATWRSVDASDPLSISRLRWLSLYILSTPLAPTHFPVSRGRPPSFQAAKKEADVVQAQLLTEFEQWHETSVGDEFGAPPGTSGSMASGDDKLDDQEAFEKLEIERVVSQDPEQLAFFQAQKTRRANATQNSIALKQMHKNKRNR